MRKPTDVIFPTVVAPGVRPGVVGPPPSIHHFPRPKTVGPGPKQWTGRLAWGYIYKCSLQYVSTNIFEKTTLTFIKVPQLISLTFIKTGLQLLTTLMFNTNRIAGILGHLQGVVGDLQTVQMQERGCWIASGGSVSLAVVVMSVAERALDEEFNDLSLSRVIGELEDFSNNVDQEGPEQ